MDVVSAIGAVNAGIGLLSRLMPNRGQGGSGEFSRVLEQSLGRQMMERLDLDTSGTLTLNETKMPEAVFQQLDANRDGQLSEAELNSGLEKMRRDEGLRHQVALWLEAHDANHDAFVSQRESGLDDGLFGRADENGDGLLDSKEVLQSMRGHTG